MIEQRYIHKFRRGDKILCHLDVLRTWCRIPSRMIMGNNHGLRINLQRRREDLPDLNRRRPMIAKRNKDRG